MRTRALVLAAIASLLGTAAFSQALYQVCDLGDLGGGGYAEANDINNVGEVVGMSAAEDDVHAFFWDRKHGMRDMGVLPGAKASAAWAVNDQGTATGEVFDNGFGNGCCSRAFVWRKGGAMQALQGPDENFRALGGYGINDAGQIVGAAEQDVGAEESNPRLGFLTIASTTARTNRISCPQDSDLARRARRAAARLGAR